MLLNDTQVETFNTEQLLEFILDKLFELSKDNDLDFNKALNGYGSRDQFIRRLKELQYVNRNIHPNLNGSLNTHEMINLTFDLVSKANFKDKKGPVLDATWLNAVFSLGYASATKEFHWHLRHENQIGLKSLYYKYEKHFDAIRLEKLRAQKQDTALVFYQRYRTEIERLFLSECELLENAKKLKKNIVIDHVQRRFNEEIKVSLSQDLMDSNQKNKQLPNLSPSVIGKILTGSFNADVILWYRKLSKKVTGSKQEHLIRASTKV